MIRTTSATIAERMRGIPFSQLPKTFQEAGLLLSRLGFKYLWIDSLCIIQDDEADWQRESAQMASIYAKAALTIAASASQDSQGGCYRPTLKLSGSDSWEIAVEYETVNEDRVESVPQSELHDLNRNNEGVRWEDDDEMEKISKSWFGGHVRSTFSCSKLQPPAMRYLPGVVTTAALANSKPGTINISEINENEITHTKKQSYQAQRPPNFRGIIQSLEHSTGVYVREVLDHAAFVSDKDRMRPNEQPLGSRAWALQERLLSTRILHFTASEIVWECNSESYCQCGLVSRRGIHGCGSAWSPIKSLKLAFNDAIQKARTGSPEEIEHMWNNLVHIYTNKSMSHSTDILPAVSGLIKRMQQADPGEVFAGMWRKHLPEHMAWSIEIADNAVTGPDNASTRHKTYVAPTWSWASVTAQVSFHRTLRTLTPGITEPKPDFVADIIDVHYALAGLDPTGSLSEGVLTIRAPTLPAKLVITRRNKTEAHRFIRSKYDKLEFRIDHPYKKASAIFSPDSVSDINTSVKEQDVLCVQWTKQVDLEPILAECKAIEWQGDFFRLYAKFLVVRQSTQRPGKYERIGIVTLVSVHKKPHYRHSNNQIPIYKWFRGASIRTLDLV